MTRVYIFGENHSDWEEIQSTKEKIKQIKPDYLLHELLYESESLDRDSHNRHLKNCRIGGECDPRLNKHIFEFALENNIPLVGIDLERVDVSTVEKSFIIRETHMVKMIKEYMRLSNTNVIAVVVGDTHLRTTRTKELGDISLIIKEFGKNPNVKIIRSKNGEIK